MAQTVAGVELTAENAETAEEKSTLKISACSAHSAVKNKASGIIDAIRQVYTSQA
jgi:hypothetical protein